MIKTKKLTWFCNWALEGFEDAPLYEWPLEPNTLDGQGPKPKPLTRPQCSWLPKAKAKESVLDISFDTDDDDIDSYTWIFSYKEHKKKLIKITQSMVDNYRLY